MRHEDGGDLAPGWYLSKEGAAGGRPDWIKGPGSVTEVRRELERQFKNLDRTERNREAGKVVQEGLDHHVDARYEQYRQCRTPENREALAAAAAEDGATPPGRARGRKQDGLVIRLDENGRPDIEPPDGVEFQAKPDGLVIETTTARDVAVIVDNDAGSSADRLIVLRSNRPGSLTVSGDGSATAIRNGIGEGDAIRFGKGAGEAIRMGKGDGTALRDGEGDGTALRDEGGNGNAQRTGSGHGDAVRSGTGAGDAYTVTTGTGNAIVQDTARGNAQRGGKGSGDAIVKDEAVGNALRLGQGPGTATVAPTAEGIETVERWTPPIGEVPKSPAPAPPATGTYDERTTGREAQTR